MICPKLINRFTVAVCFVFYGPLILLSACSQSKPPVNQSAQPSFKAVTNVAYTEVRRTFKSPLGYAFDEQGYQLTPEWKITFRPDDSVNIYSPKLKRFINCPVIYDHGMVFNIAWAWIKVHQIARDSLVFEVLRVEDKTIMVDRPSVFMTFYANAYIDKLHADAAKLALPRKKDTVFIKSLVTKAGHDPQKAFAATQPPDLKSNSPQVDVKKVAVMVDSITNKDKTDEYLNPEYDIVIHKAYADFNHSFYIFVDEKSNLSFRKPVTMLTPGYETQLIGIMKSITGGYLTHYLKATPGKTLGIPHTSYVIVNVKGIKG